MTGNRQGWIECAPETVERARGGDSAAIHELLGAIRDPAYALGVRMLADPEAARDATQEVLFRVSRALPRFRGESTVSTWVYRIAVNVMLTASRSAAEQRTTSFEVASDQLEQALDAADSCTPVNDPVLVEETRLFCTHGMLLCLDRGHRAAYILGEIFELPSSTVAGALEISEEATRKRISRARTAMNDFMRARCGLVSEAARCRCQTLTAVAVAQGFVSADRLRYATSPTLPERLLKAQLRKYASAIDVFRGHPHYENPDLEASLRVIAQQGSGERRNDLSPPAPLVPSASGQPAKG